MNCLHPDSCIDTSVIMASHNASSSFSDLQINMFDSCSTFLSIVCLDEASQCSVYCEDKYVQIAAEAFRVTTLNDADTCFVQQFMHSWPTDVEALKHTSATCPSSLLYSHLALIV